MRQTGRMRQADIELGQPQSSPTLARNQTVPAVGPAARAAPARDAAAHDNPANAAPPDDGAADAERIRRWRLRTPMRRQQRRLRQPHQHPLLAEAEATATKPANGEAAGATNSATATSQASAGGNEMDTLSDKRSGGTTACSCGLPHKFLLKYVIWCILL